VAILALLGFAWFTIFLMGKISAVELQWTRMIYLLNGVEAVAFAAAGYLFGKEVHRQSAEDAKQNAEEAKTDATVARMESAQADRRANAAEMLAAEAKANGNALKAAVLAKAGAQPPRRELPAAPSDARPAEAAPSDLAELADLAKMLFP
jgi:hypothetical protein